MAIAALLCSTMGYAQNGNAVLMSPRHAQGYLILNKADNPNVARWNITLIERTFDTQGNPVDKVRDRVSLRSTSNFWRVPNKYLNSEEVYFIEAEGFSSSNASVVKDEPIIVSDAPPTALAPGGLEPWDPACNWLCNGSYYAWEIQQYVDPSIPTAGPSRFVVEEALSFNVGTQTAFPNYRYITQGEFELECFDQSGNNIGGEFIPGVPCNPDGVWMTESFTVPFGSLDYKDLNGNAISHPNTVRGVGKPLAYWDGGNPISTELTYGNTVCGNERWWAQGMVNDNPPTLDGYPMDGTGLNFYPELTCNQLVSGGVGTPKPDHKFGEVKFQNGLKEWLDGLDDNEDEEGGGRWDNFARATVKRAMDDPSFGDGVSWHELIDGCVIKNLNDVGAATLNVDPNDPTTFSRGLSLPAGLYNFGFAIKGLGYVPFILEIDKKINVAMAMADMLSVNIYPVPITDNSFTIDMTASEALNFTYELRDGNGLLLHKEGFRLKKNQQWSHVVKPKNGVPSGNHINRFIFSDGSVLSLQTIK